MSIQDTFGKIKKFLIEQRLSPEDLARIEKAPLHLNSAGFDDWGLDPETLKAAVAALKWFYSEYFRVETVNIGRVPEGRALLVGNHGGQIPIDAICVLMSLLLEANPPRIGRGMVERWVPTLPFISSFFMRVGQIVGDQENCRELLKRNECVLVFPEGVRGSGKTIDKKYQLQRFGTGFMRLALETQAPIVPVAVIGCEEAYPGVLEFKGLAKALGLPYLPITPFFPLFGAFGMIPLPTKVWIRYGEPLHFSASADASEAEIEALVQQVRVALQREIDQGIEARGDRVFL